MRRRTTIVTSRRGPVVVSSRRGPGLIGTMARTAVIAGTATAVSQGVSGAMNAGAQQRAQMAADRAQQATPASSSAPSEALPDDLTSNLLRLADLKQAGLLTDEEFNAAKARLLGGK